MVKAAEFVAPLEEEVEATPALPLVEVTSVEPIIVANPTKRARIKGTWTQFYGMDRYDFVDGQTYELPLDIFNYLKSRSCIYDTLV